MTDNDTCRRYGFTSDCGLPNFGNNSVLHCTAGESDGLWTGIMLAADAYRFAAVWRECVPIVPLLLRVARLSQIRRTQRRSFCCSRATPYISNAAIVCCTWRWGRGGQAR